MTFRGHRQRGASFRGQPLLLLAVVLAGWMAMRVSLWEPASVPMPQAAGATPPMLARGDPALPDAARPRAPLTVPKGQASLPAVAQFSPPPLSTPSRPRSPALYPAAASPGVRAVVAPSLPPPVAPSTTPLPVPPVPVRVAVGHNLLLLAGLANMEIPQAIRAYLPQPVPPAAASAAPVKAQPPVAKGHWSADGWVMLRHDRASPLLSGRPGYGRSQAGAVLRYRLDRTSPRAPQLQVRASQALAAADGAARERELAAGLSVRAIPAIPVRVAAEMRLARTDRGTRASPAVYAVTELPPMSLPLDLRAEVYAQAGYTGGDDATPFVDGQARVDRAIVAVRGVQLHAGGGLWGGAQHGAARVDVGPSAALTFQVGAVQARVAADYRFRVAGTAEPSSGPAITLSSGF